MVPGIGTADPVRVWALGVPGQTGEIEEVMSWTSRTDETAPAGATGGTRTSSRWWAGIDAARGLALLGLLSVPLLPASQQGTPEPTWWGLLLSGHAVALVALLAGVEIALSSGGRFPHRGRWLGADRMGLAVQGLLIAVVGLGIGALMPEGTPADNVVICYAALFVLAIPFLHLSATALFACAGLLWVAGPLLVQAGMGVLSAFTSSDPSFGDRMGGPAGTVTQLLPTGTSPVLLYLTCLLVGLGLGRVRLRDTGVQVRVLAVGAALVLCAQTASFMASAAGGYDRLLTPGGVGEDGLREVLMRGPDSLATGTTWWPVITAAHSDPRWEIAAGLGVGLLVLGSFLLITARFGACLLPLSAAGAMALSLYTAHLVALSVQAHYGLPELWYISHWAVAALAALAWQRARGQGPLERMISIGVSTTRRTVLRRCHRT
jgi:hypothetical protein